MKVMEAFHKLPAPMKPIVIIQLSRNSLHHKEMRYLFQANHMAILVARQKCWFGDDLWADESKNAIVSGGRWWGNVYVFLKT